MSDSEKWTQLVLKTNILIGEYVLEGLKIIQKDHSDTFSDVNKIIFEGCVNHIDSLIEMNKKFKEELKEAE